VHAVLGRRRTVAHLGRALDAALRPLTPCAERVDPPRRVLREDPAHPTLRLVRDLRRARLEREVLRECIPARGCAGFGPASSGAGPRALGNVVLGEGALHVVVAGLRARGHARGDL